MSLHSLPGYDSWLSSPYDDVADPPEPSDEQHAAAKEQLADQFDILADCLLNSAFIAEHAANLFATNLSFRAEAIASREAEKWIEKRAVELRLAEIEQQREEAKGDGDDY